MGSWYALFWPSEMSGSSSREGLAVGEERVVLGVGEDHVALGVEEVAVGVVQRGVGDGHPGRTRALGTVTPAALAA